MYNIPASSESRRSPWTWMSSPPVLRILPITISTANHITCFSFNEVNHSRKIAKRDSLRLQYTKPGISTKHYIIWLPCAHDLVLLPLISASWCNKMSGYTRDIILDCQKSRRLQRLHCRGCTVWTTMPTTQRNIIHWQHQWVTSSKRKHGFLCHS